MKKFWMILIALFFSLSPVWTDDTFSHDVVDYLTALKGVYKTEYAPVEWKKKYYGYNLEENYTAAVNKVKENPMLSTLEARRIFMDFVDNMKDYHTAIFFYSTESATLPFIIKGTKEKYFLVYIDRTKLPPSSFPFQVGDEVVAFDNQPTAHAVANLQAQTIEKTATTDKELAEIMLTQRYGGVLTVPNGAMTLDLKAQGSSDVTSYEMVWDYTPEELPLNNPPILKQSKLQNNSLFNPQLTFNFPYGVELQTPYQLGARKTFTPDLGAKIWESDESKFFYAYIFRTAHNKLIGYLRIPDYRGSLDLTHEFFEIIERFQNTTDAMVIDQVNNPGGSLFAIYNYASMLATSPLLTPKHYFSITPADVNAALLAIDILKEVKNDEEAKSALNQLGGDSVFVGYPLDYELARFYLNFAQFIVKQSQAGRLLTDPYWLIIDHVNPASVHYTKPILLLTNHLDFSGGDFFPAILQDNKRVTILGSRTAGAGGYVDGAVIPNNFGVIAVGITRSLAERVDKMPIENLGVTPDIEYEMSEKDFTTNYQPYMQKINDTLDDLMSRK